MKINVEVNGVFDQTVIQKKIAVELRRNTDLDELLRLVNDKVKMLSASFDRGDYILLLNGRRVDPKEAVQLSEGDTVSILSPLAGG